MKPSIAAATAILATALSAQAQQRSTISTLANIADPMIVSGISTPFGGVIANGVFTEVTGVGQVFKVSEDAQRLDQYRFGMAGINNCQTTVSSCDIRFTTMLLTWSPTLGGFGQVLWVSPLMSFEEIDEGNQVVDAWISAKPRITVNSGMYAAIVVPISGGPVIQNFVSGEVYADVGFLSTGFEDGYAGEFYDRVYPDGFMISYGGAPAFDPSRWVSSGEYGDLKFEATLATTPEPATLIMVGSGLAGLLIVARRRQKQRQKGNGVIMSGDTGISVRTQR
jgi:hypothetical protein